MRTSPEREARHKRKRHLEITVEFRGNNKTLGWQADGQANVVLLTRGHIEASFFRLAARLAAARQHGGNDAKQHPKQQSSQRG